MGEVKPFIVWWVCCVWNTIRGSMRVSPSGCTPSTTPPLPPNRRHRNHCPCGECCVRWELSTPGEACFPANAELAVGRVVGRLRGGEGEGTIRCQNHESVLGFGGGGEGQAQGVGEGRG